MELLLRTSFDHCGPKPPAAAGPGLFDPLRYLSLGHGQQNGNDASKATDPSGEPRPSTATSVYEVARPILQGCHAVPTKLKILLDRALSSLKHEEVIMIVSGCGWHLEDYQRGYKLKDASGNPLDRWQMCNKMEEPLILQQFLMFKETRTITQQLILQDLTERSFNPFLDKAGSVRPDMFNKLNHKSESEEKQKEAEMIKKPDSLLQMVTDKSQHKEEREEVSSPRPNSADSPPVSPPSSASPGKTPSSLPAPMFPRHNGTGNGVPLPPSSMAMTNLMSNPMFSPMFPFPGMPGTMPATPPKDAAKEHSNGNALNLSRPESKAGSLDKDMDKDSDSGSRRSSVDESPSSERMRKIANLPEDLGIPYVSPTTGKKRVQCQVCMKTFCDKGALKIHFSAVHLREMHRCTVKGCTMMFSSRRSRNRHSANPNPKLHTPQVKRRISAHDGRTHQGPVLRDIHSIPKDSPKEPSSKENSFPVPGFPTLGQGANTPNRGMLPPAFPGLPGFNPFMPPDLKAFQDLQRFSELQRLYASKHENGDNNSSMDTSDSSRKRKSQHPTKRPHLDLEDGDHVSSDSASDEGFPDPMMEDDDDDLDNVSVSGDEAQ